MACCIGYLHRQESPYDDWLRMGRPRGALFACFKNTGPDISLAMYMRPAHRVGYIKACYGYYWVTLAFKVDVDPAARTVGLTRLLCESRNIWPDIAGKPADLPNGGTGSGGIAWLRSCARFLGHDTDVFFERAVEKFFGLGWSAVVPVTRPRMCDDDLELCRACSAIFGDADTMVPRNRPVAYYDSAASADGAATTIQRHFRGWQVRMRTSFDPHTRIGAYYAIRAFRELA